MSLVWDTPTQAMMRDAYLDWAHLLDTRRAALPPARPDIGTKYEPIFVRLTDAADPVTQRTALRVVVDAGASLRMDGHEYATLCARIDDPDALAGLPDEYALYRRFGTPDSDHAALFDVLDTGSPVQLADGDEIVPEPQPVRTEKDGATPIVAIIDDGIGFLNTRFRRAEGNGHRTRFEAVWIQALEEMRPGTRRVMAGDVLSRAEIDAMLADGPDLNETALYTELQDRMLSPSSRRPLSHSTSHGTHVLDLAAGAEPDDAEDPARDWPLLAVQLPPEALEDTSGTRAESYMVQGLRWILRQAAGIDAKAPVIVNLSIGISAGPKYGARFTEYQITREAQLWEQVTGQPVRIVWSFGNGYRGDQVAVFDYPQATQRSATDQNTLWRVQPGDQTASFLEVHLLEGADSTDVQLSLTTPDGEASGFTTLAPGGIQTLTRDGAAVARIYHVPDRDFGGGVVYRAHYVLALSPTETPKAGEPLAPAGGWRVAMRYTGSEALRASLQIQRDDAVVGFRAQALQSYFDGPDAYGWDDARQTHTKLETDSLITYAGSHNALVTATARQVFCVGAARPDGMGFAPAGYTGEGADWSVPGPTAATLGDDGPFLRGALAGGTMSGSTRLVSGTSAAAARLTRALALSASTIMTNAAAGGGTQMDDLNPTVVTLTPVAANDASRLGAAVAQTEDRRAARR
ncbi:MAG: hypothetical protein QNJ09_04945 [Paracoccaceae bacterium]|nr:hypothetical protein [Paracoccaceae bacterium]